MTMEMEVHLIQITSCKSDTAWHKEKIGKVYRAKMFDSTCWQVLNPGDVSYKPIVPYVDAESKQVVED